MHTYLSATFHQYVFCYTVMTHMVHLNARYTEEKDGSVSLSGYQLKIDIFYIQIRDSCSIYLQILRGYNIINVHMKF